MNIKSRLPVLAACFALAISVVFAIVHLGDAANDAGGPVCYDSNGNHLPAYDGNWEACLWSNLIYGEGNTTKAAEQTDENATALCIKCHRQETVDGAGKPNLPYGGENEL